MEAQVWSLIGLLGGVLGALLGMFFTELRSLGERIDRSAGGLRAEMTDQGTQIRAEMTAQGTQLRTDMAEMRSDLRSSIDTLSARVDGLDQRMADHIARHTG